MKIKTQTATYQEVISKPHAPHERPLKPNLFFRTLMRLIAVPDLAATHFSYSGDDLSSLKNQPCMVLMNHSSFIDLGIASKILYPRPYSIICTSDGFVGKNWLLRHLGCIPTEKFVSDVTLLKDILYSVRTLNNSILMYPEASYSFDGTATDPPKGLGKFLKKLGIPVIFIKTEGAFARDPLYNMLQKRKVDVSATVRILLRPDELQRMSPEEIDAVLKEAFSFDNFRWQMENRIKIDEPFRADGLERILYKCPICHKEGVTHGKGIHLECSNCGTRWILDEYGQLKCENNTCAYSHIPDWYKWERDEVRKQLEDNTYRLDTPVEIGMMVDHQAIYMIGKGRLIHDSTGFHLTSDDGELVYDQDPKASYSCYSDYYWYELGDIICIGNKQCLYYCFPEQNGVVAKTRQATEELYNLVSGS
jgi:1-acyl-sn-glycerol-3-phosphate acyltransferase